MLFQKKANFEDRHLPQYEYAPLKDVNDIRLVEIQPNPSQSAQIECTLLTARLTNPDRNYQCLSYVWGDPGQSKGIRCANRTLTVTENLHVALKYLRHKKDPVTIWIDQICINQADLAERGQQVLLMADIYNKAEKTVIWLGERADNSDLAMKVLQERGEKITSSDFTNMTRSSSLPQEFLKDELGLPDLSHKSWAALRKLLQRPWFKRSWVVQEVVVSKNAIARCGTLEVTIEALFLTTAVLEMLDSMIGPTTPMNHFVVNSIRLLGLWTLRLTYTGFDAKNLLNTSLVGFAQSIPELDGVNAFMELAMLSKTLQAGDARDKIFAFFGLRIVPSQIPDYDLSPQIIYTQYALKYIQDTCKDAKETNKGKNYNERILGLLYTAGTMNQKFLGLPSWVPDLSVKSSTKPFWFDSANCCCPGKQHRIYTAGGEAEVAQIELLGSRRLRLPAKHFDVIQEAGTVEFALPTAGASATARNLSKTLGPWLDQSRAIAFRNAAIFPTYPTGEHMLEAFKRVLTANRNDEGTDASNQEVQELRNRIAYLVNFPIMLDLVYTKNPFVARQMGKGFISKETNILWMFRSITSAAHGRVFFRTVKGYYGLAPRGAKSGDGIYVTPGGWLPMILRHVGHGLDGPEAQLLGECYVHGIMKGEVMRNTSIPLDDVILC